MTPGRGQRKLKTTEAEPVLTAGAIALVISALLNLAISYGFQIDDVQVEAILRTVAVVVPFAGGLWRARAKVFPAAKVQD